MKETEVVRLIKPRRKVLTKTVVDVGEGNNENFSKDLLVMDPARKRMERAYKKYVVIIIMY